MNGDEAGPTVNYTVKELLNRMEGKLDALIEQTSGKASQVDLLRVEARVAAVEEQCAVSAAISRNTRWILVGAFPAVLAAAAAVQSLI